MDDEVQRTVEAMKLTALLKPVLSREAVSPADMEAYTSDLLIDRKGEKLVATIILTVEPDQTQDDWHWFLAVYLCDPRFDRDTAELLPPDNKLFGMIASNFFPQRRGKVLETDMSWCFKTPVTEEDRKL